MSGLDMAISVGPADSPLGAFNHCLTLRRAVKATAEGEPGLCWSVHC